MLLRRLWRALLIEFHARGRPFRRNPLTAHFGGAGKRSGAVLPHVMRLNLTDPAAWEEYTRLAEPLGLSAGDLQAGWKTCTAAGGPSTKAAGPDDAGPAAPALADSP
jgi:hypothetical protein